MWKRSFSGIFFNRVAFPPCVSRLLSKQKKGKICFFQWMIRVWGRPRRRHATIGPKCATSLPPKSDHSTQKQTDFLLLSKEEKRYGPQQKKSKANIDFCLQKGMLWQEKAEIKYYSFCSSCLTPCLTSPSWHWDSKKAHNFPSHFLSLLPRRLWCRSATFGKKKLKKVNCLSAFSTFFLDFAREGVQKRYKNKETFSGTKQVVLPQFKLFCVHKIKNCC